MASRKIAPKAERLIALFAGESGAGKSFVIGCLRNARIYDTDLGGGLSYLDARITANASTRIEVGSYLDIFDDLKRHKSELDGITTLAIDHVTTLHAEAVLRHNPAMGEDFGRSYDKASREWKKLRELVRWGDFNLICTAHLKSKYELQKVTGVVTDGAKNIEADMSIVLYLQRSTNYPSLATVRKWRRDPEDSRGLIPPTFPFTLEKLVELHGYPLEGQREEVPMANEEQIKELRLLLDIVKLPEDVVGKWKTKAKAESWSEFTATDLQKCIDHLNGLLTSRQKPEPA